MAYVYFIGCSTTKGSSYACAIYTLIIKAVALAVIGIILTYSDLVEKELTELAGGVPFVVTKNFYRFAAIHCSIYFVKAAILLYAVKKNSRLLIIPWMTGTIQDFSIKLTFIGLFLKDGGTGHLVSMFFVVYGMFWFMLMLVYEFFCVASHYHFLSVKSAKEKKK